MGVNLSHFIFNSDYPMDKVVFYKQLEETIPANSTKTVTITHNLLFTPLPLAVWATNSDFSDASSLDAVSQYFSSGKVALETAKADATNITLSFNSSLSSSKKIYIRVYGLLPENATQEAAPTSRQASKLIFDTDKVYAPLIFNGVITSAFNSNLVANVNVTNGYKELITQANRVVVEHNLGTLPYMLSWLERNNEIQLTYAATNFQPGYPLQYYTYSDIDKCGIYCGQSEGQHIWHIRIYANV